jgi:hypothetical protein
MTRFQSMAERGTVTLVAACLTAVIGIGLLTYVAMVNRTMDISNRAQQNTLSQNVAEMGLEYAMQALNTNDWSSWTLDTTNRRATRTVSFTGTKFGAGGGTATVNLRIDNYDAYFRSNTWVSGSNYRINDLVGYNGAWYRCVKAQTPSSSATAPNGISNLEYWVPEGVEWQWNSTHTYRNEEMVNYNSTWYRCISSSTPAGTLPTNATYWTSIPYLTKDPYYYNTLNSLVNWYGTWYNFQWNAGGWWEWSTNAPIFWYWHTGNSYNFNDIVCYSGTWYRCIAPHTSSTSIYPTNTSYWAQVSSMWTWSSTVNYKIGDVATSGGLYYRCIRAHSNQAVTNTSYWLPGPHLPVAWDPGRRYSANDTVFRNGTWYLGVAANNGQDPATDSSGTSWVSPANTSYQWNSSTAYAVGAYRSYGGVWYRCLVAHTNQSPGHTTYWSAQGATVVYSQGQVSLPGRPVFKTQFRGVVRQDTLFPNAVASTTTVTVTNGGTIDSYNGSVGSISTAGVTDSYDYNQTASPYSSGSPNVGFSAVLAAAQTSGTAITLGTPTVKGYLAAPSSSSAPYAPQFSVGATASLRNSDGTVTSPHSTATNVDLTRISRSPVVPQFDPIRGTSIETALDAGTVPAGLEFEESDATLDAATGLYNTITLGTPGATTPSIYHYDGSLYLGTSYTVQTIKIIGPVILYVGGDLQTLSGGWVEIESTGSLELHCAYFRSHSSSHGIWNRTDDPKKLLVIGDTTGSSITRFNNGNSTINKNFVGAMYAPATNYSVGFEVRTGVDVYGAISAKEVTFSSEADFHYDTSLRHHSYSLIEPAFTISDWRELTASNEKATF